MKESPGISLIIPYHKKDARLVENLEALARVRHIDEILLISDKLDWDPSLDAAEFIAHHREELGRVVRVIKNANHKGVSGSRNTGIENASSELIAFLDYDDRFYPERFDADMEHFKDPDCELTVCCFQFYEEDSGTYKDVWKMEYDAGAFHSGMEFYNNSSHGLPHLGCFTFRRSSLLKHGLRFDESLVGSEDTLFRYQSVLALGLRQSPDTMGLCVNRHGGNTTLDIYSLKLLRNRLNSYYRLSEFYPWMPRAYNYFQRPYKKTLYRYLRKTGNPFPVLKHILRLVRNSAIHMLNPR
jgi:glycosyltransferase involved in cell wall biosynthesis